MNYKVIADYLGRVLLILSGFMLLPLGVSFYYREPHAIQGFLATMAIMLLCSLVLGLIQRGRAPERGVYVKDSFAIVAFCWLCIALFGALPYWISGDIATYGDSLFESVSGFTTTGASILTNVEAMSKGMLFWRSFTHWIGGMGVLIFLLAASNREHSVHVMKAESPGPTPGKLTPRLRQSSKILYSIYIVMTLAQVVLLLLGDMPLYESLCCAMSTAGTGGFHSKNTSIAEYSFYIEMVVTFFMVFFGINFNMIYFLLIRNFKAVLKGEEFRVYIGIFAGASLAIALNLLYGGTYSSFGTSLRYASFQVSSMMTTTGFYSANFDLWPQFSRILLFVVMLIGASAGSTGGGIKVSRIIILLKESRRLLYRMSHPRAVQVIKLDGKAVDNQVVDHVSAFFVSFAALIGLSILLVSFDNFDFETTVTSVLACVGNAGPGLSTVAPIGNYSAFSLPSKLVLSLGMLMGRLEIYPILLLMSPRTWRRV